MLDRVNNLSCADLQNVDTRTTRAENVILIIADLKG